MGLKYCLLVQEPERAVEGLGGTYFFKDDLGNKVAIVKPCDEEPLAPNNPKVGSTLLHPVLALHVLTYSNNMAHMQRQTMRPMHEDQSLLLVQHLSSLSLATIPSG